MQLSRLTNLDPVKSVSFGETFTTDRNKGYTHALIVHLMDQLVINDIVKVILFRRWILTLIIHNMVNDNHEMKSLFEIIVAVVTDFIKPNLDQHGITNILSKAFHC